MGGASKFAVLLATPFSLIHHRRPSLLRLARSISVTPLSTAPPRRVALSPLPIKASSSYSQEFHSQTDYNPVKPENFFGDPFSPLSSQHPWPEWSKFVDTVASRGYLNDRRPFDNPDDAFVSYDGLPEQFVRDAAACLAFARDKPDILGLLSRKDIEILTENGTAFLFKRALDTEIRMSSFLGGSGRNYVVESDKAQTVDLMKYIVSYASNPTASGRSKISNPELTESSVRNLLTELLDMSCRALDTDVNTPEKYQLSGSHGQTSRFLRPKIEMKRGDWICPKCSFMNFARNIKCLECEEPRPKRQLTGGEWECPQCDFHNYGMNLACLRCDCKRPGEASLGSANSRSAWGYNNGSYANKDAVDSRLSANEEKAQQWFKKKNWLSKVSQQNPSDLNDMATNEDFPEILDRRLANSQNQNNWGKYDTRDGVGATDGSSPLPRSSSQSENSRGINSTYVPFVPLPADMFAKRTQQSTSEDGKEAALKSSNPISSKVLDQTGAVNISNESVRREESFRLSEKPSIEANMHNEGKEQEGKSERWFKRVQELHDVPEVASALLDEDFPEIMPMRKGGNRFVISKKKDRSLTSPGYKRQKSMEQGSNAEFVPFVPFPPDYFAKKDKQQPGSRDSTLEPTDRTLSKHSSCEKSGNATPGTNDSNEVQRAETQQTSTEQQFVDYRGPTNGNPTSNSIGSQTSSSNSWNTSRTHTASQTSNSDGSQHRPLENPNVRSGFRSGKTLEGSAVKEPDPLDMSEEAKAERWFRRVAQIKDISELSQIPDEDFPSIMPMRKGVNRFVVSKRKTPLERRLTSTQYRKNLPVVNSDHVKKENDSS